MVPPKYGRGHVSISSIGIQTVTATTGTGAQRPQSAQPQHSASNDNGTSSPAAKNGSAQTVGRHVDKRV